MFSVFSHVKLSLVVDDESVPKVTTSDFMNTERWFLAMGFYDNHDRENKLRSKLGALRAGRWIGVVVLSALTGSGATVAVLSAFHNSGLATPVVASSALSNSGSPVAVPTSVNVSVSDDMTQVVKKVEPAVMAVVNYADVSNSFSQQSQLQPYGVGTGVFFYTDGQNAFIVTNNHVVQNAAKVEVVLGTGKHVNATVVGTDPYTDLAVLKIAASNLNNVTPVTFANSDLLQAGEPAIAIGTPMGLDFADSVTSGIISAPKRIMPVQTPDRNQVLDNQTVIQTDAAINPGNSGGPLLNIQGQVIGINSSKIVEQDVSGMGFAIPSNQVQNIANQLMKTGHALHPALGISEQSLSDLPEQYVPDVPVNYGVVVEAVSSAQAKSAGLQPQDVIVSIDGHPVKNDADLRTYLFQDKPGQTVKLQVYRGSHETTLNVQLTTLPSPNTTANNSGSNPSGSNGQTDPLDPFSGSGN